MKICSFFIIIMLSCLIFPSFIESKAIDIEIINKDEQSFFKEIGKSKIFSLKKDEKNLKPINQQEIQPKEKNKINIDNNISDSQNVIININLEDNNETIIIGNEVKDKETGEETLPTISFITNYNDTEKNIFDISDIEEKSLFQIQFKENNESYIDKAQCRLWKPKNENIRMFCRAKFLYGKYTFDEVSFTYNIIIKTEHLFNIKYEPEPINFLYYDKQLINLNLRNENYILKFKYDLYIKGGLYLKNENNYILLNDEDCETKETEKELIYTIKRNYIEQNLIKIGNFKLWTLTNYYLGTIMINSVLDIIIEYDDITKKPVMNVKIDDYENNIIKAGEYIAFKAKSLPNTNIITDKFNMNFLDINNNLKKEFSCYLKKIINKEYLNLLCLITEEGSFLLSQHELTLNNIHYKYSFSINKEQDSNIFNVTGKGSQIYLTYASSLNITLEDSITLKYLMEEPSLEENIVISQNDNFTEKEIIKCNNYNKVKLCIIPINFFEGKNNGYFYTYHFLNSEYKYFSQFYESNPFNLILPPKNLIILRIKSEDNSPNIYIGNKGIITLITDYNDTSKNIFNESNITFNSSIKDLDENIYEVIFTLWKGNGIIRMFCKLKENLKKRKSKNYT